MLIRFPHINRGVGMIATSGALPLTFCLLVQTPTAPACRIFQYPNLPAIFSRALNVSALGRATAVPGNANDASATEPKHPGRKPAHGIPPTYNWPKVLHPTPYEIFNITDPSGTYTKTLFYELVKLYHPDRCRLSNPHTHTHHIQNLHHDHMLLPDKLRLERFRMIVLANEILSDPRKRQRYDRYGLGWVHNPSARGSRQDEPAYKRSQRRGYGDGSKWDASQNATWEDWERYYERTSGQGESQQPLYMTNLSFVFAVTATCAVGGYLNLAYATGVSQGIIDDFDKQTAELADDLERRRRETLAHGSKEERIKAFLQLRDPVGWELQAKGRSNSCLGGLENEETDQKGSKSDGNGSRRD